MPKIFDIHDGCPFRGRKIVFDTNVWIAIDGFDPRPDNSAYSDFYADALRCENEIIVTDYIIGELFNRTCKLEYRIHHPDDPEFKHFKYRRKTEPYNVFMEAPRDTCLHILDNCKFELTVDASCRMIDHVNEIGQGLIDLTDLLIQNYCIRNSCVLVTHDGDFAGSDLELATANSRTLRAAATSR